MPLLPFEMSSVRSARSQLRHALLDRGVEQAVVEDASLVLSELVANALLHGKPLRSDERASAAVIKVTWLITDKAVQVSVTDGGDNKPLSSPPDTPLRQSGRGLRIVGALSDQWGAHGTRRGHLVWASVSATSGTSPVRPAAD